MRYSVKINQNGSEEVLSVKLSDILSLINKESRTLNWRILWLNYIGIKEDENFNVPEFEKAINNSDDGVEASFDQLLTISENIFQLMEFVVIGYRNDNQIVVFSDELLKSNCDFFIELVDSSYWEITTRDIAFMKNLVRKSDWEVTLSGLDD